MTLDWAAPVLNGCRAPSVGTSAHLRRLGTRRAPVWDGATTMASVSKTAPRLRITLSAGSSATWT
eukprot:5977315-Pyramimonas_sp.AAC.1